MATNFLNITLPTVSVTLGPEWASEINAAFEVVDLHDHSSGKGVQVPASGLNINDSLSFETNKAYNLLQVQLISNNTTLIGSVNANSVYVKSGDLYFTNSGGNAVQITSGGSVVTSAGALQTVEIQGVAGNVTILPSDTFVFLTVNTAASRIITLPLASGVASGRVYIIKDITGTANTYPITVAAAGSDTIDGAATSVYDSNFGSFWVVGDGATSWYIA